MNLALRCVKTKSVAATTTAVPSDRSTAPTLDHGQDARPSAGCHDLVASVEHAASEGTAAKASCLAMGYAGMKKDLVTAEEDGRDKRPEAEDGKRGAYHQPRPM